MKKNILLLLCIFLLIPFGCKKYPEGPLLSFRSQTKRLINKWKIHKVLNYGDDITLDYINTYTDWSLSFEDSTMSRTYTYVNKADNKSITRTDNGTWNFIDKGKEIEYTYIDSAGLTISEVIIILKLRNKEFWYKTMDEKMEFHLFEPKVY